MILSPCALPAGLPLFNAAYAFGPHNLASCGRQLKEVPEKPVQRSVFVRNRAKSLSKIINRAKLCQYS
jgi:hypothetical protein